MIQDAGDVPSSHLLG
jgi:hypothetical protein